MVLNSILIIKAWRIDFGDLLLDKIAVNQLQPSLIFMHAIFVKEREQRKRMDHLLANLLKAFLFIPLLSIGVETVITSLTVFLFTRPLVLAFTLHPIQGYFL